MRGGGSGGSGGHTTTTTRGGEGNEAFETETRGRSSSSIRSRATFHRRVSEK